MSHNFNSTVPGDPYTRIQRITIDRTGSDVANIEVLYQRHVLCRDGTHEPIGAPSVASYSVGPEDLQKLFDLIHIGTGQQLGAQMTNLQLMSAIFSNVAAHLWGCAAS